MLDKIKSKLLTKLFIDWVNQEIDIEALEISRTMIEQRETAVKTLIDQKIPRKPIGFQIPNGGFSSL